MKLSPEARSTRIRWAQPYYRQLVTAPIRRLDKAEVGQFLADSLADGLERALRLREHQAECLVPRVLQYAPGNRAFCSSRGASGIAASTRRPMDTRRNFYIYL